MDRRGLIEFAERDWGAPERLDGAFWRERKRKLGAQEGVRIGDELRRHAQAVQPEWPTVEDRAADLEHHVRLSEMLRRAGDGDR